MKFRSINSYYEIIKKDLSDHPRSAWIIMFISLVLTYGGWQISDKYADQAGRERFDHRVDLLQESLTRRMIEYKQVLRGGVGLFTIQPRDQIPSRKDWKAYVEKLNLSESHKGIQGFAFSRYFSGSEKEKIISTVRKEGFSEFNIKPERDCLECSSIIYIEPFDKRNMRAFGFDMLSEATRREALEKARDSGQATMTGIVKLVQETKDDVQKGFLLYLPVYRNGSNPESIDERRKNLVGWVYSPFRIKDLVEGILGVNDALTSDVDFELFDVDQSLNENLLYGGLNQKIKFESKYKKELTLNINNRSWKLVIYSKPHFVTFAEQMQPLTIAFGGILVDILLFLVITSQVNQRKRAMLLVDKSIHQLQKSEERFDLAAKGIGSGIWDWDVKTNNVYCTQKFYELLAYPSGDSRFVTFSEFLALIHSKYHSMVKEAFDDHFKDNRLFNLEIEVKDHNGDYQWFHLTGQAQWDSNNVPTRMVGSIININDRKIVENEVIKAKNEAEKTSHFKSAFLSNMSHEIRTPMNAIIGMADLLLETKLDAEQIRYVEIFKKAGTNLLYIIDDILDISKIESGKMRLDNEVFVPMTIINEVVEVYRSAARQKGLEIQVNVENDFSKFFIGDQMRLQQILMNLIGNSIKFTDVGRIMITAGLNTIKEKKGNLIISVSDTGIGISPLQVENLFQSFVQADISITKKYGGTGLGLTICKKLIELMGGEIWIISEKGIGSTFSFTVNMPEALNKKQSDHEQIIITKQHDGSVEKPLNILIVDDSEDNKNLIKFYLRKSQHKISEAIDGEEAFQKYTQNDFDLVIMDVQMPILDGYSATKKIRNWEITKHTKKTPIIAITAYVQQEEIEKSILAGCDMHIPKPIRKQTLLDIINRYSKDSINHSKMAS